MHHDSLLAISHDNAYFLEAEERLLALQKDKACSEAVEDYQHFSIRDQVRSRTIACIRKRPWLETSHRGCKV